MKWIFWLILIVFLVLASFLTTLPLIIVMILLVYLFYRDSSWVLVLAFIFGLFLDVQGVGHIGRSSIFLLFFIFIVSLYERRHEIDTVPFVFFAAFIGSFLFLEVLGYDYIFIQSFANSIIAITAFIVISRLRGKDEVLNS